MFLKKKKKKRSADLTNAYLQELLGIGPQLFMGLVERLQFRVQGVGVDQAAPFKVELEQPLPDSGTAASSFGLIYGYKKKR